MEEFSDHVQRMQCRQGQAVIQCELTALNLDLLMVFVK